MEQLAVHSDLKKQPVKSTKQDEEFERRKKELKEYYEEK